MSTKTQYNPQAPLNARLLQAGVSKTVYALVTPETEGAKAAIYGNSNGSDPDARRAAHLEQFRDAWTGKQQALHLALFERWLDWSAPVIDLPRHAFPFFYPTAGASEALRHLIYAYGNRARSAGRPPRIHVFRGEYEGYKAYGEAAAIEVIEHDRAGWQGVAASLPDGEWFFLSQPSAIDGNLWPEANVFMDALSARAAEPNLVIDVTYVGAIPEAPAARIGASFPCLRNVVFSLSKPFGAYYDRIGGVLCREEDAGLFGNIWFKSLAALQLGCALLEQNDVFALPRKYRSIQLEQCRQAELALAIRFKPSDVYVLATAEAAGVAADLADYLRRPAGEASARLRVCLTPGMAALIGTAGPIQKHREEVKVSP
jgi:hypothetical protein